MCILFFSTHFSTFPYILFVSLASLLLPSLPSFRSLLFLSFLSFFPPQSYLPTFLSPYLPISYLPSSLPTCLLFALRLIQILVFTFLPPVSFLPFISSLFLPLPFVFRCILPLPQHPFLSPHLVSLFPTHIFSYILKRHLFFTSTFFFCFSLSYGNPSYSFVFIQTFFTQTFS